MDFVVSTVFAIFCQSTKVDGEIVFKLTPIGYVALGLRPLNSVNQIIVN